MMGRWRSGASLASCPVHDDPAIGADPAKNNAFLFREDDPLGYATPLGSHIRRVNPRDAAVAGVTRYSSHDSARHGVRSGAPAWRARRRRSGSRVMFAFVGANLGRQFEFVQSEWMNDSAFFGGKDEQDPIAGCGRW